MKLKLNPNKTEFINMNHKLNLQIINHNNVPIKEVTEIKYLGVTPDRFLTYKTHIDKKRQ